MSEAALCGQVALWAAGLCAAGAATAVLVVRRNPEACNVGLASGIALGMFVALAWHVSAACAGY